jgi:hypothetical protein
MLVLLGVLACTESKPPGETGEPLLGDDSSSDDTATSTPDDTSTETGDSGTDEPGTPGATVSDLAATEHPVISSIVVVTWTQDAGAEVSARPVSWDGSETRTVTDTTMPSSRKVSTPCAWSCLGPSSRPRQSRRMRPAFPNAA